MEYKATIELHGAPRSNYDEKLYLERIEVSAETIGGVLDALVEKSYDLYFQFSLWLMENKPSDYSLEDDYWYVTCSWPSPMNPYNVDSFMSAGSSLNQPTSLVETVVHYRHMAVQGFLRSEVKYMRDGYYRKYVDNVKPIHGFFDLYKTNDVSEYKDYGYKGVQLDQVFRLMGDDHVQFLKDYSQYRSHVVRGTAENIVIPKKESAPVRTKKSFWNFLKA